MILRRLADGIKNQDWFVVFIELLIVVFGVYIGIYLGDIQEIRKLVHDTNQSLVALEGELRSDLERLDEVIDHQTKKVATLNNIVALLNESEVDEGALAENFLFMARGNDTFFQNRSAYQAMQTSGHLSALPDDGLRLQITRLFEREFERQEFGATLYDELNQNFWFSYMGNYWDTANNQLITDNPYNITRLRNGASRLLVMSVFYLGLLENTVRPELVETLEMIDAYQGENAK